MGVRFEVWASVDVGRSVGRSVGISIFSVALFLDARKKIQKKNKQKNCKCCVLFVCMGLRQRLNIASRWLTDDPPHFWHFVKSTNPRKK